MCPSQIKIGLAISGRRRYLTGPSLQYRPLGGAHKTHRQSLAFVSHCLALTRSFAFAFGRPRSISVRALGLFRPNAMQRGGSCGHSKKRILPMRSVTLLSNPLSCTSIQQTCPHPPRATRQATARAQSRSAPRPSTGGVNQIPRELCDV